MRVVSQWLKRRVSEDGCLESSLQLCKQINKFEFFSSDARTPRLVKNFVFLPHLFLVGPLSLSLVLFLFSRHFSNFLSAKRATALSRTKAYDAGRSRRCKQKTEKTLLIHRIRAKGEFGSASSDGAKRLASKVHLTVTL